MGHSFESFHGTFGTARQIHDERFAADAGSSARKHGSRCVFEPFAAHLFGDSRDDAVGNGLCGFRGVVPRTEAGPTRRQNHIDAA